MLWKNCQFIWIYGKNHRTKILRGIEIISFCLFPWMLYWTTNLVNCRFQFIWCTLKVFSDLCRKAYHCALSSPDSARLTTAVEQAASTNMSPPPSSLRHPNSSKKLCERGRFPRRVCLDSHKPPPSASRDLLSCPDSFTSSLPSPPRPRAPPPPSDEARTRVWLGSTRWLSSGPSSTDCWRFNTLSRLDWWIWLVTIHYATMMML